MVFSPALPLVDGLIPLILFSVSKFEGKEKDHILFRGRRYPTQASDTEGSYLDPLQ